MRKIIEQIFYAVLLVGSIAVIGSAIYAVVMGYFYLLTGMLLSF